MFAMIAVIVTMSLTAPTLTLLFHRRLCPNR